MAEEEQIVLEEEIDENYEPSQDEIRKYAEYLGMDVELEQELLWVARQGLKEPLPRDWKPCQTPQGDIYYFNFTTGDSIWDHPCDEQFRNMYLQEKQRLIARRQQLAAEGPQVPVSTSIGSSQQTREGQPEAGRTQAVPPSITVSEASSQPASVVESPISMPVHQSALIAKEASMRVLAFSHSTTPTLSRATSGVGTAQDTTSAWAASAPARTGAQDWHMLSDMDDKEQRRVYWQKLDEERGRWERMLALEACHLEGQVATVRQAHQEHLWAIKRELADWEAAQMQEMQLAMQASLAAFQADLQAKEAEVAGMLQVDRPAVDINLP